MSRLAKHKPSGASVFCAAWDLRNGRTIARFYTDEDGHTLQGDGFGGFRPSSWGDVHDAEREFHARVMGNYPHARLREAPREGE